MRFGYTKEDRETRKDNRHARIRAKYRAKRTKMLWFAWRPVWFEDGNWGFLETVRCHRSISHVYDAKWKVGWWKYNPINITNDKILFDYLQDRING